MRTYKAIRIILLAMAVIIMSTGCLSISADDLYSLPEVSEEYLRLQAQINMVLGSGAAYAPPTRGLNRQAIQLCDIDGDGVNEVIVFFTFPSERKLKIYVFTLVGEDYIAAEIIESVGTEIESVRYIDMNDDGSMEIIIGWQMGSTLKYMSIYSIVDFHSQLLVSGEEYSEITAYSSAGGGGTDVVLIKLPTQEAGNATAKLYSLMQDGEIVVQEARLSAGIESINSILTGNLADSVTAVFIESEGRFDNGSLVTDILAVQNGSFTNITLNPVSGISVDTVRHRMNSLDVEGNGIILVPTLRRLIAQSDTEYFAIDWYAYKSDGSRAIEITTYHNTFDEWYLILPRDWREKVSVRREDSVPGERTIIFSYFESADSGVYEDFLAIYKLSGENAQERAQTGTRELLMTEGTAVYAFELLAPPDSFGLTFNEEMVRENFRLIHAEWQPR